MSLLETQLMSLSWDDCAASDVMLLLRTLILAGLGYESVDPRFSLRGFSTAIMLHPTLSNLTLRL